MDSDRPIAVFLGPSLPVSAARALLDARYLPPARFGDVYRLIGHGVHTIVLIDGVFHGSAPVWQRELLYAMQNGIRVYGASSMGALRAAELHAHGMIGLGTVFQWYMTGAIDGDDEVALLHADEEQCYRPLSEPLVNLRCNLRAAADRGLVTGARADALIAAIKAKPFWERTRDALWDTPAYLALPEPCRAGLRTFFADSAIDLKHRDAARALTEVARRQDPPQAVPATPTDDPSGAPCHRDHFRLLKRSIPCLPGQEIEGRTLVERALADPDRRKLLTWLVRSLFFVLEWARESRVHVPPGELETLEAAWREHTVTPSFEVWLRAGAMSAAEHRELLSRHLLRTWLLARDPETFGLPAVMQSEALLPTLPDAGLLQPIADRAVVARALPYVAAWCRTVGALPDPGTTRALAERWRHGLTYLREHGAPALCEPFLQAVWAMERGPEYFGYTTWSPATELLGFLQITGTAARLAEALDIP